MGHAQPRALLVEDEDARAARLLDAQAKAAGWEFGGTIAGHLAGQFPHENIGGFCEELLDLGLPGD